jgi:hypothetical protein
MRFKAGFVVGCAVGAWAVAKASHVQRPGVATGRRSSRDVDLTAEKVRAIGDLARERLTTFLDSPAGEAARERVTDLIGSSLAGVGAQSWHRPIDTSASSPR